VAARVAPVAAAELAIVLRGRLDVAAADADLTPHVAAVRVGDRADKNDLEGWAGGGKGRGRRGDAVCAPRRHGPPRTHVRPGGGFRLEGGSATVGVGGGVADGDASPDDDALDGAEIRASITAKRVIEMLSDGFKGDFSEASAQPQAFGSVLAVRPV